MKKLVLALSFVFILGLVAVNAQDAKPAQAVKKEPVKTEKAAASKLPVKSKSAATVKPTNNGAKKTDDAPAEGKALHK